MLPTSTKDARFARCFREQHGFTLFELMIVLLIIGILAAIVSPLVPALLRANQLDSSVNNLAGILEEARESAVSGNTFVWVAFTDPIGSPTGTWVATFQSQDGTETTVNTGTATAPAWATTLTIPSANLLIHSRLQNLPTVSLDYNGTTVTYTSINANKPTGAPLAPTSSVGQLQSGLQWTVTTLSNTGMPANSVFKYAIEFTPDGQAHVPPTASNPWSTNYQFGLLSTLGSTANASKNMVLFNISRLTGKATVYRK